MKIINNPLSSFVAVLYSLMLLACVPKEEIVFKGVSDIAVDISDAGKPILRANGYFFNPNKVKMKLKEVNVEVFVDGTKSATVKHELDVAIAGKSDFSVPITAELVLKQNSFQGLHSSTRAWHHHQGPGISKTGIETKYLTSHLF